MYVIHFHSYTPRILDVFERQGGRCKDYGNEWMDNIEKRKKENPDAPPKKVDYTLLDVQVQHGSFALYFWICFTMTSGMPRIISLSTN